MNNPNDQNILNVNTEANPISNENCVDGNQNPTNPKKKKKKEKKRKPRIWKEKMKLRKMTVLIMIIN